MFNLIIWIGGKARIHGFKRREFTWHEARQLYLYGGREYTPQEFNAVYEKAMKNNADMLPRVSVVPALGAPSADAPNAGPSVAQGNAMLARIADLEGNLAETKLSLEEAAGEIVRLREQAAPAAPTLAEAIAVVAKLAPERLKKSAAPKHGPAPAAMEVE